LVQTREYEMRATGKCLQMGSDANATRRHLTCFPLWTTDHATFKLKSTVTHAQAWA
jgi:hypothetical protein